MKLPKIDRSKIKTVVIRNEQDIRKAILPFQKKRVSGKKTLTVSGTIKWTEEGPDKKLVHKEAVVSGDNEDADLHESLIAEFDRVKEQRENWERIKEALDDDPYAAPLPIAQIDNMYMSVDRIIKHRLGGTREGLTIVWNLNNKKYVFDPYTGSLEVN